MANGTHAATVAEGNALAEQAYCWQAHLAGYDVRTIAKQASAHFGKSISYSTVWRRIEAERVALRQEIRRAAEDSRDVELARLDGLTTEAMAQAERARRRIDQSAQAGVLLDVNAEAVLEKAIARIQNLSLQRSKLLGLEVIQVEVSGTIEHVDAEAVELARLLSHVPDKAPADA